MRILRIFFALAVVLAIAAPLIAQNNNPCPGDKEYQFNIIGTKDKNPEMKNNNGHRIFVKLNGKTSIYMTGDTDLNNGNGLQCGNKFDVLDANGTDGEALILVPCDPLDSNNLDPAVCFEVYATPLGTPNGHADVNVYCDFNDDCIGCNIDMGDCYTGLIDFDLARSSGRPVQKNITKYFRASGCIDIGGTDGVCDNGTDIQFQNEWIFNIAQLEYYYWEYDNYGNRITQIRFCNVEGNPDRDDCDGGSI